MKYISETDDRGTTAVDADDGETQDDRARRVFRSSGILFGVDADGRSTVATCFVLAVPRSAGLSGEDFIIATARHTVSGALAQGVDVDVDFFVGHGSKRKAKRVVIAAEDWFEHAGHDVAVAVLKDGGRLGIDGLSPIPFEWLYHELEWTLPPPVTYFGGVAVGDERIICARTGAMPTIELPWVALVEPPDLSETRVRVALVEGTVNRGMSGGPVFLGANRLPKILGLIHGYTRPVLTRRSLMGAPPTLDGVLDLLHEFERELAARQQLLVYVVPAYEIVLAVRALLER